MSVRDWLLADHRVVFHGFTSVIKIQVTQLLSLQMAERRPKWCPVVDTFPGGRSMSWFSLSLSQVLKAAASGSGQAGVQGDMMTCGRCQANHSYRTYQAGDILGQQSQSHLGTPLTENLHPACGKTTQTTFARSTEDAREVYANAETVLSIPILSRMVLAKLMCNKLKLWKCECIHILFMRFASTETLFQF